MHPITAMGNHTEGNGRTGRNVALPDENRPTWRPQDEHSQRVRRSMSEEDDRYEDERYPRHWEDRSDRGFESRNQGYPGSFEDRYRDREREHGAEDRYGGRGGSAHYERGYQQPERYERSERYGGPRGYGYSDGDRPNLGTGGGMQSGSVSGTHAMPMRTATGTNPSGHRGKGPSSYQRSDERIRELICEALTDDDRVDATNIEVSVKNGEVALMGTVDDRQMKRVAEDVVENVGGVKDVQNQIRVGRDRRHGS